MAKWKTRPLFQDTLTPYEEIDYKGIQYINCRDFNHISRYRPLRQVIHNYNQSDRLIALESVNTFDSNVDVTYYEVPAHEENRLDIIASKTLGLASYSWIIAYFNQIEDGFTCREGQTLRIPKSVASLFNTGELLSAINPMSMNLGSE